MQLRTILLPVVALSSSLLISSAFAQTWDRGAGTNNWDDADNWSGDQVPVNDGTADLVFGSTGAGTVEYGTTVRSFNNLTISGGVDRIFSGTGGGELNWSGVITNEVQAAGTQRINGNTALTGTGSLLVRRTLRLGDFDNLGSRNNTFSGGVVADGGVLIVQYGSVGTGGTKTLIGTGDFQAGTGLLNSNGGGLSFNQIASARMTFANNFINAITRDGGFGSNQFEIRYDGGLPETAATVTRLTGDFTTAALTGGSTGHGWTVVRGRAFDGQQFSRATFELSGDWTGYAPVSSKFSLMHGAFVLENVDSIANIQYTLNANNANAQSTVLALGDGFGANTFNRNINIEVGTTGNSNAANAINQTYIGGRQNSGTTNAFSSNITFNNTNAHRLNLFSESGRTEFSGNISASSNQVVAINSGYSMSTYDSIGSTGQTDGNALTAFTPDGVVVFNGGSKTFAGGLEVEAGTLMNNQSITGNVNVLAGATIGTDGGTSVIVGDLTLAQGAFFAFSPMAVEVTGAFSVDSSFGVESLRNSVGDMIDWSLISDGEYTLVTGAGVPTFDETMISNFGIDNAFDIGNDRLAYFENGSLTLVVVPEPGTFALIGGLLALGFVVVRRRR